MSENRRQLLKDAMDNKETYRIPMGFWHHFVLGKDQFHGTGASGASGQDRRRPQTLF